METRTLSLQQETEIKAKAVKLKAEKKLRKIFPMVVFGDEACDEKPVYVAYLAEPTFPQFSKFMAASKKDEVTAMRTLVLWSMVPLVSLRPTRPPASSSPWTAPENVQLMMVP